MIVIALLKGAWKDIFCGLILLGKILFFPFFVVSTIVLGIFGILELFTLDVLMIVFKLLSKDRDIKGLIKYWWD